MWCKEIYAYANTGSRITVNVLRECQSGNRKYL